MRKKKNITFETNDLTHCPRCLYSFEGLPSDHQCPECGLQYDSRCKAYYTLREINLTLHIILFSFSLGFLALSLLFTGSLSSPVTYFVFLVVVPLSFILFFVRQMKNKVMPYDCALSSEGLHYKKFGIWRKMIRWENISHVSAGGSKNETKNFSPLYVFTKNSFSPQNVDVLIYHQYELKPFLEELNRRIEAAHA